MTHFNQYWTDYHSRLASIALPGRSLKFVPLLPWSSNVELRYLTNISQIAVSLFYMTYREERIGFGLRFLVQSRFLHSPWRTVRTF